MALLVTKVVLDTAQNVYFETDIEPENGLDPGSTETVSRYSTTLLMGNHPVGWPLLYETLLGMFCLYRKVTHAQGHDNTTRHTHKRGRVQHRPLLVIDGGHVLGVGL